MRRFQKTYTILSWAIMVAAYLFLAYQLLTFNDYATFFIQLTDALNNHYLWLIAAIGLLPVNVLLEALKWQQLLKNVYPISLKKAIISVLWGQTGGFLTPNRLGEFPTRTLTLPQGNRSTGIAMGFIGSIAQTIVISAVGIVACLFFIQKTAIDFISIQKLLPAALACAILLIVSYLCMPYFGKWISKFRWQWTLSLASSLKQFRLQQRVSVLLYSTLRYVVFSFQYYCMLRFANVYLTPAMGLIAIPTFYLLMTYTPTINISEVGIRASYAILTIGLFSSNTAAIAFASIMIWLLNFCLLMVIGSFLVKKTAVPSSI